MPRFFFDVDSADSLNPDVFGRDCLGDDEAHDQAISLASHIARERTADASRHPMIVTVLNDRWQTVDETGWSLDGRWWPGRRR